jgi:WD40 repeat protein
MVNTVAWSPDGTRLASGSNDGTVRVWDANTGATLVIYQHHTNEVLSLSWSPDGRRIVSGSLDGTAQVWDAQSGKLLVVTKGGPEVSQTEQVLSVAWSSDTSRIASLEVDANTGILDIWDALTGARFSSYPVSQQALALAWSPDGKRIALAGGLTGASQIWNGA